MLFKQIERRERESTRKSTREPAREHPRAVVKRQTLLLTRVGISIAVPSNIIVVAVGASKVLNVVRELCVYGHDDASIIGTCVSGPVRWNGLFNAGTTIQVWSFEVETIID